MTSLRPSNLPKIAVCPKFESSPFEAGLAAQRGTLIDEAFRDYFLGLEQSLRELDSAIFYLDAELAPAQEGVRWAIDYIEMIANGAHIETDEDKLRVTIEELDAEGGTMDADIPSLHHGFDMKSGQIRNYREQMAAYALGRMRAEFCSEYKMTLLFSDQKEVVNYTFTYDEAEAIVKNCREAYYSPHMKPVPCDYCGWCGAKDRCHERKELATQAAAMNVQERWEDIKSNPDMLGDFLLSFKELESFYEDGKKIAKSRLEDGSPVTGFKLQSRKGNEYLPTEDVLGWLQDKGATPRQIVEAYGSLSKAKAKKLAEELGASLDDAHFARAATSSFIKKV